MTPAGDSASRRPPRHPSQAWALPRLARAATPRAKKILEHLMRRMTAFDQDDRPSFTEALAYVDAKAGQLANESRPL